MARTDPQLNIRIPAELKAKLEDAAKLSGRSVTTELIYRLEESFKMGMDKLPASVEAHLAETRQLLIKQYDEIWKEMQNLRNKKKPDSSI